MPHQADTEEKHLKPAEDALALFHGARDDIEGYDEHEVSKQLNMLHGGVRQLMVVVMLELISCWRRSGAVSQRLLQWLTLGLCHVGFGLLHGHSPRPALQRGGLR